MTTYVGTNFSRDVALGEPSLKISDFGAPGLTPTTVNAFITFTGDGASDITTFTIDNISLQGQSTELGTFHVSTEEETGEYLIDAVVNNVRTGIVLTLTPGTKDIPYTYSLGKLIVDELPAATGTFKVGNKNTTATVTAIASDAAMSVTFDDIGKPDMTWNGAYSYDAINGVLTMTYNKLNATTLKECLQITVETDTADSDVAVIDDIEVSKVTISYDNYTAATNTNDGEFDATNVTLTCSRLIATTHDNVKHEFTNIELSFIPASGVTMPTAFIDTTNEKRIAVRVPSTSASITITNSTNITLDDIQFVTPSVTFIAGGSMLLLTSNVGNTAMSGDMALKSILGTDLILYNTPRELTFEEQIRFRDGYKPEGKTTLYGNSIVQISGGMTFYDQIIDPYQNNVLNINKDAGFSIPIAQDGVIGNKYVRISDIYTRANAVAKSDIVDLPDRLHALEVALCYQTSDVLESEETEAERLHDIKDKYKVLDVSAMS